ncbi:MAG: type III pantothenate kinase [Bacteroidota bacterium]
MNLVIDIGNTLTKVALFENNALMHLHSYPVFDAADVLFYYKKHRIEKAVISSVGTNPESIFKHIREKEKSRVLMLDHHTPLPFKVNYKTPETLGKDRLASAAAAFQEFPGKDILVVDAGSCITYDVLTRDGTFQGGAISPGVTMRYNAMHTFTQNLPQLKPQEDAEITGKSTAECMHSGVINAAVCEVDGMIEKYLRMHDSMEVVMTGGDLIYFDKKLKNNIFARPKIVLKGLNIILENYFEN